MTRSWFFPAAIFCQFGITFIDLLRTALCSKSPVGDGAVGHAGRLKSEIEVGPLENKGKIYINMSDFVVKFVS